MNSAALLTELQVALSLVYPTRRAFSGRPGRTTCVIIPDGVEWDEGASCDPWPMTLTVEVHILSAASEEQGAIDVVAHVEPVVDLIRQAGFTPQSWRSGSTDSGVPRITITAVADGEQG